MVIFENDAYRLACYYHLLFFSSWEEEWGGGGAVIFDEVKDGWVTSKGTWFLFTYSKAVKYRIIFEFWVGFLFCFCYFILLFFLT